MKKLVSTFLFLSLLVSSWAQTSTTIVSESSYVSISTNNADFEYSYIASFNKEKTATVAALIKEELGAGSNKGRETHWLGDGYDVELNKGRVRIEVDKEKTTEKIQLKMEALAAQISEAIGGRDTPEPPRPPRTPR